MAKNKILIITDKEIAIPEIKNSEYHIDLMKIEYDDDNLTKILNTKYSDEYDYLFFTKRCRYVNEFLYYLPVNYIKNNNNQLYINELKVNSALLNNVKLVVDNEDINDIAILVKYLLKNDFDEKNFHLKNIVKEIKKINNLSNRDISLYKQRIYKIVQQHYSQGNLCRIVKYKLKKEKIIKDFAYKNLRNVLSDLKVEIKVTENIVKEIKEKIDFDEKIGYITGEKIRVILADDNIAMCNFLADYLKKFEDVEVLGVANNDKDEINLIEELKPNVVITDLMRNGKYTGLDIIKKYKGEKEAPCFLVISADKKDDVMPNTENLKLLGYIMKPFTDYSVIIKMLRKLKKDNK